MARQSARKGDFTSVLTLTNNLSSRWLCRWIGFCNCQTDWVTIHAPTSLLSQDDLQVRWFGDVEEVLRVSAPELILATVIVNTFGTSGVFVPFGLEGLLNGAWKLN